MRVLVVARRDDALARHELHGGVWQAAGLNRRYNRLLPSEQLDKVDCRAMAGKSDTVLRRRPGHALHPCLSLIELCEHLAKLVRVRENVAETMVIRVVESFHVGGDDAAFVVGRASHNKLAVGAPRDVENGRLVFLDDCARPPLALCVVVADGHDLGGRGHCELAAVRGPLDRGGAAVDAEDDQVRHPAVGVLDVLLPGAVLDDLLLVLPHVGVTVMGARHKKVDILALCVLSTKPVQADYRLRVLTECVLRGFAPLSCVL
mmetsp:Transcript_22773/g.42788  ORF Transcript_22773/g.42788 Transcript_22773/m.42788 type:complete len:261 (+) Transcript_22773:617-1399(+)